MPNKLIDVFQFSEGRCVVFIDDAKLGAVIGDQLVIAGEQYEVTGIEMVSYNRQGLQRLAEGWKPPLGLSIRAASKDALMKYIGSQVSVVRTTKDQSPKPPLA